MNKFELEIIFLIVVFKNFGEKIINEFVNWSGDVMNISGDFNGFVDLEELYKII